MKQEAPDPVELYDLVENLEYRPGWTFTIIPNLDRGQGSKGLTLDIVTTGYNSHHLDQPANYRVHHYMIVPPASFDRRSWQNWLFQQLLLIEEHEAMEFFRINGEQPYAPNHGPGNDPYMRTELATDEERRTNFKGQVKG